MSDLHKAVEGVRTDVKRLYKTVGPALDFLSRVQKADVRLAELETRQSELEKRLNVVFDVGGDFSPPAGGSVLDSPPEIHEVLADAFKEVDPVALIGEFKETFNGWLQDLGTSIVATLATAKAAPVVIPEAAPAAPPEELFAGVPSVPFEQTKG